MDTLPIALIIFIAILVWLLFGGVLAQLYDDWRKR